MSNLNRKPDDQCVSFCYICHRVFLYSVNGKQQVAVFEIIKQNTGWLSRHMFSADNGDSGILCLIC